MLIKNVKFYIIVFVAALLSKTSFLFAAQNYKIASTPGWVQTITIEKPTNTSKKETVDETNYLLIDRQTKVDQHAVSYFNHVVKKVLKNEDIPDFSTIEIEFNPSYEEITLHQLKIHRSDRTINQLFPHHIKILQREKRLEEQLYTGIKSLYIFLEDVRIGDVIEYSYVVKNTDPVSNHTFFYNIFFSGTSSISQIRERLLWPKERHLAIKNHSTSSTPEVRVLGDHKEYIWNAKNTPILQIEENIPFSYNPYEYVEISENLNWHDIALQKLNFYAYPQHISEELKIYIKNIIDSNKNPEDQFITVMRFIQDEIQYRGIAGPELSRPSDPSLVFRRRFGDCKDKTLLAITILKELGIEAYPALVNTNEREAIHTALPSFHIFDHAIVVACIHGKQYWIDPTCTFQRGSLENLAQPDYGYALIVDSKTTSLTKMPVHHLSTPSQEIYETFDLRQGYQAPGTLSVKTIYKNHSANTRREYYLTTPKKEIQQALLNYYQKNYPSIRTVEEPKIIDDPIKNQITIFEKYELDTPWTYSETDTAWSISYYANEISAYLDTSHSAERTIPLSISHPVNIFKQIQLLLREKEWNFVPEKNAIRHTAFIYKRNEEYKKNTFTTVYEFKTLKDHVDANDVPSYTEKLNQINEVLGVNINDYVELEESTQQEETIQSADNKKDYINWTIVLFVGISAFIFIFISLKLYYFQPKYGPVFLIESKYNGIGGWLILPVLGLILNPFSNVREIFECSHLIFSLNNWMLFSDATSAGFHPFRGTFVLLEIVMLIAFLIFNILLLVLLFKKKRSFPILYVYFIWTVCLWSISDNIIAFLLISEPITKTDIRGMVSIGLATVIWSLYFFKSERVKAIFIKD